MRVDSATHIGQPVSTGCLFFNSLIITVMARILLSAIVTEIRGKIGGTVFQAGQGGFQAKRLVTPRNPNIPIQVTRRNSFLAATTGWAGIGSTPQGTWSANPDTGLSGYTTYVRRNAIMRFFNQAPFTSFPGNASADTIDVRNTTISSSTFTIIGNSPFNALSSGQNLAVLASRQMSPGRGAFSPSAYVQIAIVTGPHDFSSSHVDITTAYVSKFGALVTGRLINFKTMQIVLSTGNTTLSPQGSFIIT